MERDENDAELEYSDCEKRFEISKCLNNPRVLPTNILAPISAE